MHSLEDKQDWMNRLKKIEGQVRGLQSMVEASRSCSDVMMQISSVRAAIHQLSVKIFETHLRKEFHLITATDDKFQLESDECIKELITILCRSFK
ncbi:MAG: metal-sensitive transcriptional regulator [Syntrophomonas sp.]